MCGRYYISHEDAKMSEILHEIALNNSDKRLKYGEIYPNNLAPILYKTNEQIHPNTAIWGFPKFKGKGILINARAETAAEKQTFCQSLYKRRCLIPCTGFYEWDKSKRKFLFRLHDGDIAYIAGFYNDFNYERRFMVLTTEANESVIDVHNRMPLILPRTHINDWIEDSDFALQYIHSQQPCLYKELS